MVIKTDGMNLVTEEPEASKGMVFKLRHRWLRHNSTNESIGVLAKRCLFFHAMTLLVLPNLPKREVSFNVVGLGTCDARFRVAHIPSPSSRSRFLI